MTIAQIESLPTSLLQESQAEITRLLKQLEPLDKGTKRYVAKRIQELLYHHNLVLAQNLIVFWLINDSDAAEVIRRDGYFRPSRYNYNVETISKIAEACLSLPWLLDANSSLFFQSIVFLVEVAPSVRATVAAVDAFILNNRRTFLKTVVVYTDLLFMYNYRPNGNPEDDAHFSSKEEIADAVSFLIFRFTKGGSISSGDFNYLDEEHLFKKKYWEIFSQAISIRKYQEFEVSIESFGFHLEKNGTRYELAHQDKNFRRSIGLGYSFTELHKYNGTMHSMSMLGKIGSLFDFSERYYDGFKKKMFDLATLPVRRYRMNIVDAPPFWKIFQKNEIFLEDLVSIEELKLDLHATTEEILTFSFGDSLSVFDILKVRRFFFFLRHCFGKFLKEKGERNHKLVARSLVPVFKRESFHGILENLIGKNSAEDFIKLYGWDATTFFDLQYQPIIVSDTHYMVPVNITGTANLVRNLLMKQKTRLFPDGTIDPITRKLRMAFEDKGAIVSTDITYSYGGANGDIDLLAVLDQHLFFIEAKNSLLPASTTEQRTTYDYIQKAGKQLEQLRNLMSQQSFCTYLGKKVCIPIQVSARMTYCIVSGNRLFLGYRERGFPVIFLNELCLMIEKGTITLENVEYYVYDPTTPVATRVESFVTNNPIHPVVHQQVELQHIEYSLDGISLGDTKGLLNFEQLAKSLKSVVFGKVEKRD